MPSLVLCQDSSWVHHKLRDDETLIGRHADCHVRLNRSIISAHHARLFKDGDHYYLEDLGSRNGTSRNGCSLEGRVKLCHNDEIRFAHDIVARFEEDVSESCNVPDNQSVIASLATPEDATAEVEAEAKLAAILEITQSLAGSRDVSSMLDSVLHSLFRIFVRADRGCILLKDEKTGKLMPRVGTSRSGDQFDNVHVSQTIMNAVLDQNQGILCADAGEEFDGAQSIIGNLIRSIICAPIPDVNGEPIGIVSLDSQLAGGQFTSADLNLLMIVASHAGLTLENARLVEKLIDEHQHRFELQRQRTKLEKYFSPKIVETLQKSSSEEDFDPKIHEITVLFCDIRGFSLRSERTSGPNQLQDVLDRCTEALEVMTRHILDQGGNISDFQGDAALGYWGWPVSETAGPVSAARAALDIAREFSRAREDPDHPLADFHIGVGIAHGPAIAGKIGCRLQSKIGVFGPPINLGARLESMTKQLRVPVLMCECAAEHVREANGSEDWGRLRRLARLLPYGSETPLSVYQLLLPTDEDPVVSDADIERYEAAVDAFSEGMWSDAVELLNELHVDDRAQDFLLRAMLEHNHVPPSDWNGIYRMTSK